MVDSNNSYTTEEKEKIKEVTKTDKILKPIGTVSVTYLA